MRLSLEIKLPARSSYEHAPGGRGACASIPLQNFSRRLYLAHEQIPSSSIRRSCFLSSFGTTEDKIRCHPHCAQFFIEELKSSEDASRNREV
jgi:hypothetical protein